MYCDECKDQAHAEKEELIRQRDAACAREDAALLRLAEAEKLKQGYYDEALKGWQKFRDAELQIDEIKKAFRLSHSCVDGKCWICMGKSVVDHVLSITEKPFSDLGLDFATYEAAKKEQAEGKRIPIEDVIKRKDVKLCYKCGKQEASENFAVCEGCYKDPLGG